MKSIYVIYIGLAVLFHVPFDCAFVLLPFVPPIEEITELASA